MKWFDIATSLIGTREIVGPKHNPTILAWAKRLGSKILGINVVDDETAWCGLFVAHCIAEAGIAPAPIAVRASSWATWGSNLRADRLAPGAILVFQRAGGGHVAFYVGEDATTYHVLGGNQSNAVSITRIEKARCVARRWPTGVPVSGAPVWVNGRGTISKNEA
ncbi:TIGR02594 family protein [Sphingomonas aracearum]|uniref:TIGR02594 family protein n=1 Tax=Sphingomonas aracearum TaxID=2283317 RepID=A0A369VY89_9SPHN|nr:TIGR02594 family protein [Sphingomonas aracearum]RDE06799.1 TIGR02594 family protein [Sphingomonas aracearum]